MLFLKPRKKKLINPDFKNGTKEYFNHAMMITVDSSTKSELLEILNEIWNDGRLQGRDELETRQPDDFFDPKHGHELSNGRLSKIGRASCRERV